MIKTSAAIVVAAAILSAGGCSFSERFADQATDYNRTVEAAANRELLLNVLRARDRLPLYFSSISKLTGAVSLSINAGAEAQIAVPGIVTSNIIGNFVGPSTSVTTESSPFFDLAPRTSRGFMIGMLTPVDMSLIDYYWQQGWPEEMLLYLMVEKVRFNRPIRFCDEKEAATVIVNDPEDEAQLDRFRKLVEVFRNFYGMTTTTTVAHTYLGPVIAADAASGYRATIANDLGALAGVDKENLEFAPLAKLAEKDPAIRQLLKDGKGSGALEGLTIPPAHMKEAGTLYLLTKHKQSPSFHFVQEPIGCDVNSKTIMFEIVTQEAAAAPPLPAVGNDPHPRYSVPSARALSAGAEAEQVEDLQFHIYMRSPQRIFAYLGQILRRVEYRGKPPIRIDTGSADLDPSNDEVLFALEKMPVDEGGIGLAVEYSGETYGIPFRLGEPPSSAGRSTEVLALLSHLLALNEDSKDLPSTTTTVIAQ